MKPIEEIKPLLEGPKKVVVTMHQKPDADAMGSSLAMYHYLRQKGHEVAVISPTNFPDFLKWMPGADLVLDFESMQDKAMSALEGIDAPTAARTPWGVAPAPTPRSHRLRYRLA